MFSIYSNLSKNIINDKEYVEIQKKSLFDTMYFLLKKNYKFFLSLRFSDLIFEPKLNKNFENRALETKFFVLPVLNKEHIVFKNEEIILGLNLSESNENIGEDYEIIIPIFSILHILSENREVIFSNQLYFNEDLSNQKKSIDLFLNNPENKDFN